MAGVRGQRNNWKRRSMGWEEHGVHGVHGARETHGVHGVHEAR